MKMTDQFLSQLEAEARRTRHTLEHAAEDRDDWKPHEKSMPLGRLVVLVAGKVVSEHPRHEVLRDTFMHLAHHRGQLTVYLRLTGATVPAIYGPSADESLFD